MIRMPGIFLIFFWSSHDMTGPAKTRCGYCDGVDGSSSTVLGSPTQTSTTTDQEEGVCSHIRNQKVYNTMGTTQTDRHTKESVEPRLQVH